MHIVCITKYHLYQEEDKMLMSNSVYVLHAIFIVTIQDHKYIYNLMYLQLINSFRFGGGLLDSCSIFHLRSSVDTQDRVQNNIYSTVFYIPQHFLAVFQTAKYKYNLTYCTGVVPALIRTYGWWHVHSWNFLTPLCTCTCWENKTRSQLSDKWKHKVPFRSKIILILQAQLT